MTSRAGELYRQSAQKTKPNYNKERKEPTSYARRRLPPTFTIPTQSLNIIFDSLNDGLLSIRSRCPFFPSSVTEVDHQAEQCPLQLTKHRLPIANALRTAVERKIPDRSNKLCSQCFIPTSLHPPIPIPPNDSCAFYPIPIDIFVGTLFNPQTQTMLASHIPRVKFPELFYDCVRQVETDTIHDQPSPLLFHLFLLGGLSTFSNPPESITALRNYDWFKPWISEEQGQLPTEGQNMLQKVEKFLPRTYLPKPIALTPRVPAPPQPQPVRRIFPILTASEYFGIEEDSNEMEIDSGV